MLERREKEQKRNREIERGINKKNKKEKETEQSKKGNETKVG